MNLRQLEILRAVIRHRTTVAAADELALSQPAISNALKAMRRRRALRCSNVQQSAVPTSEAMALYKESEAIFALHAKLENRVRDLRECRSDICRSCDAAAGLQHHSPALSPFCTTAADRMFSMSVAMRESSTASRAGSPSSASARLSHHPGVAHEWFTPVKWSACCHQSIRWPNDPSLRQ